MAQQDSPVLVTGATGNTGRAVVDALARQGVPVRAMVSAEADLLEDYAHYRRGEAAAVAPTVAEITGRPPRDVWQFARDYAPAFTG
jgi:NAD(P)-dependent dehydrogenase (short-subunit alcohol dehydrogenase family)